MKFTKSIWQVSWPRTNAASYQPSFFHNYLTLIALYKLKNKRKTKKKTITQAWPRTSRKHEWSLKTLQESIVSWNYNSTVGYLIPRASIHNGMVWRTLCCTDLFPSLRFLLMIIITFPDPSLITLNSRFICSLNLLVLFLFCLFVFFFS